MKEEYILEIFVTDTELEIFPEESNEEQSEQQQVQVPVTNQAFHRDIEITQNRKSGQGKFFPCSSESNKEDQKRRAEEKRREDQPRREEKKEYQQEETHQKKNCKIEKGKANLAKR